MSESALAELRQRRDELQHRDDVVSYVRRVAQGRLDLVSDMLARAAGSTAPSASGAATDAPVDAESAAGVDADPASAAGRDRSGEIARELTGVLADRLLAGDARPPRPADDFSDDPLSAELDRLCAAGGFGRLAELDADALAALAAGIETFEQQVSTRRRELFVELDAVTDELVERLRVIHGGPDAPSP